MRTVIVNIGLETSAKFGTDFEWDSDVVVKYLEVAGFEVHAFKVEKSDTEDTLIACVSINTSVSSTISHLFNNLSKQLFQEAIAFYVVEEQQGYLVGEYAEEWGGEFNPEYFLI